MNTQDVSLSQNTKEKVRGKELKTVWDDVNGWNEAEWPRWKVEGDWSPHIRPFRHDQTNNTLQIRETRNSKETKLIWFLR